jgi:acetolactate decarboxylase
MRLGLGAAILLLVFGCAPPPTTPPTLYQVSTFRAIADGIFEGMISIGSLKTRGDFGVGTLNGLDGELIVFGGIAYQASIDGSVNVVPDSALTPFAAVTFFTPQRTLAFEGQADCPRLFERVDRELATRNIFTAVQVDGSFPALTVRSVPKQSPPYPPLATVIANQTVFNLQDQVGTLVGIWTPDYLSTVNSPGWHFHYLASDRRTTGHVLDCQFGGGVVKIAELPSFTVDLPETEAFRVADLSR